MVASQGVNSITPFTRNITRWKTAAQSSSRYLYAYSTITAGGNSLYITGVTNWDKT